MFYDKILPQKFLASSFLSISKAKVKFMGKGENTLGGVSEKSFEKEKLKSDLYNRILALSTVPITHETIWDTTIVSEIVSHEGLEKILSKAKKKLDRWVLKKKAREGKEPPEHSKTNMREALITREFINVVLRYVNGAFHCFGTDAFKAYPFTLNLYKWVKEKPVFSWPELAETRINYWKAEKGYNEGYLKVCAHMLLKTLYYIMKTKRNWQRNWP
jgi:hypothetical protein